MNISGEKFLKNGAKFSCFWQVLRLKSPIAYIILHNPNRLIQECHLFCFSNFYCLSAFRTDPLESAVTTGNQNPSAATDEDLAEVAANFSVLIHMKWKRINMFDFFNCGKFQLFYVLINSKLGEKILLKVNLRTVAFVREVECGRHILQGFQGFDPLTTQRFSIFLHCFLACIFGKATLKKNFTLRFLNFQKITNSLKFGLLFLNQKSKGRFNVFVGPPKINFKKVENLSLTLEIVDPPLLACRYSRNRTSSPSCLSVYSQGQNNFNNMTFGFCQPLTTKSNCTKKTAVYRLA